ncbi:MAG: aminodeoxychorismate/anthranilate synthase component II [Imperialibacter sp.]|uniref:anthranilate synthase component II n=1 Tax=Imperialibacter sp. TaxID=2038411 RepID=UPI0032EC683A
MKILVLDNYDSFTYNLVHILVELGYGDTTDVFRNDKISLDEVEKYDKVLLSPGPGLPKDAGIMPELLKRYSPSKSILGVCLGHQAIGEAFGGELFNMPVVLHGVANDTIMTGVEDKLFETLPDKFRVCRYHSWSVVSGNLPADLLVTSRDAEGNIMSMRHKQYSVRGVQFHPESILTEHGKQMINNWVTKC